MFVKFSYYLEGTVDNMFGMIESLAKAAAAVVTVPVALVADVVTLGGALSDKDQPIHSRSCKRSSG